MNPAIMTPHNRRSTVSRADTRADLPRAEDADGRALGVAVILDSRWSASLENHRVQVPPAEAQPAVDEVGATTGTGPRADDHMCAIQLVPAHAHEVNGEHVLDLLDTALASRPTRGPGYQRRYPPQRGLPLGVAVQLHTHLRVGDRGDDQLGETDQPGLAVRRQQLLYRLPARIGEAVPQTAAIPIVTSC
jgi:hypothetical protein